MTINWKIKLTNKQSSYLGNSGGTTLDDLDKVASALGVSKDKCFDLIQNIRIVKVSVRGGDVLDGVKFFYQVETKDKNIEVEGHQHGGLGGVEGTWEFRNDWWLLCVRGSWGNFASQILVRRLDLWAWNAKDNSFWSDGKGTKAENAFELFTSACFFSRTVAPWGGNLVGAIGCYWGELTDSNLSKASSDLTKMFLLLQRSKNIQQLKEETKDKVLLTASKKELLEKWKEYPQTIFLYQSQHKGEYSVLFVNKEKQKAVYYPFVNGDEWRTKTKQEVDNFLSPIGLKVAYWLAWGTLNPNNDLETSGYSAIILIEFLLNKIKKEEKYNLGDDKKDQGANNYVYDWSSSDWPETQWKPQQTQLKKDYENITSEDVVNELLNLTKSKELHNKLVDEWNTDFFSDFGMKVLSVDSLKDVKAKLTTLQTEKNDLIREWNTDFLTDFGDKLNVESLKAVKAELDKLDSDNSELEKKLTTATEEKAIIEKAFGDIQEAWTDNFGQEFGMVLRPEGLSAVKEEINELEKNKALLASLKEYWEVGNETEGNLVEFGETITRDNLVKIRARLYDLGTELGEKANEIAGLEKEVEGYKTQLSEKDAKLKDKENELTSANNSINTLTTDKTRLEKDKTDLTTERDNLRNDVKNKDTALAEKDNTINNLNQQIAKATTADEEKLKLLQNELNKKNELISQLNQYKEEILKTKRVNVKKDLTLFYQGIGLDDDPLKKKYNGDFISIINEKLTLDNEENMKKAFKVVACICATEKAQEWTKGVTNPGPKLLSTLEKIRKGWEEVEKYPQISKENNSFYLDIIAKRQEYKKEFDGLIGKYKQVKRTIEVRGLTGQSTVSLSAKDLAEERTIFQISKKEGIKEKLKGYLDLLKKEYPGAKEAIEKIENEQEVKENLENYSDGTNTEDWLMLIRSFTNDETIIAKIKEGAEAKVKKIFSSDASDDDITKDLKTQPLDSLLSDLALYKGDEIVYAAELIEKFYLGWLSKHVQEVLTKEEPSLSLANLDKNEWGVIKQKVFADLYGSWENTTEEEQIDNLRKKISADVVELDALIAKARKAEKAKFEKWIKENISDKTKSEDLVVSEADIDKTAFSPSAKQQAKWKLQEKKIELMPETTAEGRIKKHLLRVKFDWERWDYLVKQKDQTNSADYAMALMFAESFGKTVAQEMLPKVIAAITKDTMEGYRNLDQEWGQNLLEDDGVKYNENRDYYEVWETLRKYLHEEKANKDKWMKTYLKGIRGAAKFEQIEKQQQSLQTHIEVPTTNNK